MSGKLPIPRATQDIIEMCDVVWLTAERKVEVIFFEGLVLLEPGWFVYQSQKDLVFDLFLSQPLQHSPPNPSCL